MMSTKEGVKLAPPTKNPSMSGSLANSVWKKNQLSSQSFREEDKEDEDRGRENKTRTKFFAVFRRDGTTIDDSCFIGDLLTNFLGQVSSNCGMSILCLLRGCHFSSSCLW